MRLTTEYIGRALQAVISVSLITIVITQAGFSSILEKMKDVELTLFVFGFCLVLTQTMLAAIRWHMILQHLDIFLTRFVCIRTYFCAMFFNQLLPASLGGDIFKFLRVHNRGHGKDKALVAVLSERLFSIMSIVLMAVPALVISVMGGYENVFYLGLALIAFTIGAIVLTLSMAGLSDDWRFRRIFRSIGSVAEILKIHIRDMRLSIAAIGLSIVIQSMTVIYVVVMVKSMEVDADPFVVAAMVPFIFLVASLPISLAGWGIREGAMVYGLGIANVNGSTALVVSIMLGLHLLFVGLLGGVVWLYERHALAPE
jgi:uncharacterized protein (TIRG00374 family)